ncbi:MAG: 2'-5' RNA ligase family protein, partial [Methanoregula sp.]|nr:2'-5' RNA ligase family protein [Methanoregula sp.]
MEETYLVEIRPARTRWRIKEITTAIARGFGVENFQELHPHITLFGPFCRNDTTTNYQILDIVGSVAGKYGPIPFMLAGFEKREGMHGSVIAFSVCPSEELRRITADLVRALAPVTESLNVWDGMPEKKWYHVTVANGLSAFSADTIASALCIQKSNQQVPAAPGSFFSRCAARFSCILRTGRFFRSNPGSLPRDVLLDDAGLRITVMHNNDILGEYDLIRKCWIPEEEIGNPRAWQELMARYRRSAGFELPAGSREDAGPEKIFVISDLHLGHENIIR